MTQTAAMAMGVTKHLWELPEFLDALMTAKPCDAPKAQSLAPRKPETTSRELPNDRGFLRIVLRAGGPAAPSPPPTPPAAPVPTVTSTADPTGQLDLLSRLGVRTPDAYALGWAFAAALLGWLGLSSWRAGRRLRPPRRDPLAAAYVRLCRKLARVAPARAPHQGPLSFADTVAQHRPDLAAAARELLGRYAQLRYGVPEPTTRARDLQEFRRAVARLSLTTAP